MTRMSWRIAQVRPARYSSRRPRAVTGFAGTAHTAGDSVLPLPAHTFSDIEQAIKEASSARVLVLGGRLAEDGKVELAANRGAEELEFRVWAPGRPVAPTVSLFVDDEEWDCDCQVVRIVVNTSLRHCASL